MLEVLVAISAAAGRRGSRSREQRAFRLGLLDDGFDHEIRGTDFRCREVDAQACRGSFGFAGRAQAFAKQLARARQRGLDVLLGAILQRHVEPLERTPRGDVAAHRAGADDVNVPDSAVLWREVAQPLAQLEHVHEIAARLA